MDKRIGYLLKRVQAGLRSGMDEVLEAKELTTPQYAVLSALEREPGISNAELARRSFVTPQTMIRIVENLESLGLIGRKAHPTQGRVLMATLTAAGARLVASCHAEVSAVEARMLRHLGATDRETLRKLLERCAAALEDK
ncbi:MAG TPA: MarR family transcriptional regulator [Anaeromyxobacteraceae bacterium]|nr:MarR family transcriptional regulator [Anaeromyxobacteraceae bacterium]